jgi:hypothetical protein
MRSRPRQSRSFCNGVRQHRPSLTSGDRHRRARPGGSVPADPSRRIRPGGSVPAGAVPVALLARSQGRAWRQFTAVGVSRDGGMADLLTEAAAPLQRFAVVVCEDMERSARDTFNALKLERNCPPKASAIRHRRARLIEGNQRHHSPSPAGQAGCRGMVPLQLKERPGKGSRNIPWPAGISASRPTGTPPTASRTRPRQGRPEQHQEPTRPGPGPRARGRPDLRLAPVPSWRVCQGPVYAPSN